MKESGVKDQGLVELAYIVPVGLLLLFLGLLKVDEYSKKYKKKREERKKQT